MAGAAPRSATPPECPEPRVAAQDTVRAARAPTINGYEIDGLVGSGGCGTVWRARETGVLQRTVAVKVLREDSQSPRILARFHAERQILASMDHPCIVSVHAAGVDMHGRPWFAMPYVDGTPLTEAAEALALSIEDRIELLDRVAGAIEHAHQRGIIHRDLKPQNVLVPAPEAHIGLQPKIIDFGVAKAVYGSTALTSSETLIGQRIGTPGYMSPEQFAGQPVDTRTDIWSIGVLMHELLTGARPQERLCESVDVWAGQASPAQGFRPASDVAREQAPGRLVDADLDAIVSRCLQEDREARYASVSQLRDDLLRWRRREPVSARVHSTLHEFRLFLRRNRSASIAVATAFAVTCGLALLALRSAHEARGQAIVAERALARARLSEEFTHKFLVGNAGLHSARRDSALLMRVLNSLEPPSGEPDPDGPLADATRHAFLGRGYAVLREWTAAEPHLMAAYGILDAKLPPGSERTIDVLIDVLRPRNVVFPKAVIGEAQRHLAAAARTRDVPTEKVRLLEWHVMLALPTTLDSDEARKAAISRMRAHLARMQTEHPAAEATLIAASESILRCAWSGFPELGHEDAQQILRDVDAGRLAHSGPGLLMALSAGGYAAGLLGHQQFCVDIYERFGDRFVEVLGLGHRSTFDIHNNAGFALAALGREREAIEVLRRMLPWTVLEYGESGPHAQLVRNNLQFAEARLAARTTPE